MHPNFAGGEHPVPRKSRNSTIERFDRAQFGYVFHSQRVLRNIIADFARRTFSIVRMALCVCFCQCAFHGSLSGQEMAPDPVIDSSGEETLAEISDQLNPDEPCDPLAYSNERVKVSGLSYVGSGNIGRDVFEQGNRGLYAIEDGYFGIRVGDREQTCCGVSIMETGISNPLTKSACCDTPKSGGASSCCVPVACCVQGSSGIAPPAGCAPVNCCAPANCCAVTSCNSLANCCNSVGCCSQAKDN